MSAKKSFTQQEVCVWGEVVAVLEIDSMSPCVLKKHSLPLRDSPRSTCLALAAQKMKLEEKILRGQNT